MTTSRYALEGIRVLDLGRYQAGPRAGLVLARLGAEVIKVEAPGGDESRKAGPTVRGQSVYWVQYNSGKKSLGLNLRTESGKKVLRDLVKVSDVFIQNFRPGTIDKMGFSYEKLRSLNKGIVMVNVSAYGQYGPYRDLIGFDPVGQAISGMMMVNGFPDMPPMRAITPVVDRITALHATIGALAALHERQFSGEGQCVDVCLADTGYSMTEIQCSAFLGSGTIPKRIGNGRGPQNVYKAKDGWVMLAAMSAKTWPRFCNAIGAPEWIEDSRFSNRVTRDENNDIIEERLEEWFAARTVRQALDILSPVGIPCSPVNDVPAAATDAHLHEREVLMDVPDPMAGRIHVTGKIIKLSRSDAIVGSAPTPGQHTRELLTSTLGYSDGDIAALEAEGAVYSEAASQKSASTPTPLD